ncbi:hypothetical protein [Kaarinaea lacus]
MNKIILQIFGAILFGCVTHGISMASSAGQFVFAGTKSVDADVLSATWSYGIRLSENPDSISKIKLSCDPIPGSTFTVKETDIKPASNGVLFLDGPVFRVSKETTPWLYEKSETTADCKAVIVFHNQPKMKIKTSVSFSAIQKVITLTELKSTHEYNKKKGSMKKGEEQSSAPKSNKPVLISDAKDGQNKETVTKKAAIAVEADKPKVVNKSNPSTKTFKQMFSGMTVSGSHTSKGFMFKDYFADNGQLLETRDNGKHKKGNWTIDEQGKLCIVWKNKEACGQLKLNSDGSVSFIRGGGEKRRFERFESGNTLN